MRIQVSVLKFKFLMFSFMRIKLIKIVLFAAMVSFPGSFIVLGQDNSLYEKRIFISGQDSLLYRVMFPEDFDPSGKYPLIFFLHGAGERGDDNEKQLMHGGSFFASEFNRKNYPAIVIFPQCKTDNYWANVVFSTNDDGSRNFDFNPTEEAKPPMSYLLELIDSYLSEPYTDLQRVYIGGLSMGGMATFELLYRKPEIFAAAFPVCGGGNPDFINAGIRNVKIRAFHGEEDTVVKPVLSVKMIEAFKVAGADASLTLYPGVGHNAWDYVFKEEGLLPWLFSCYK